MRRKRLTLKIRSSKRFSSNKKLEQPYVSYSLPPIVLLCFCVLYYCLFFTSSPANYEPPHSISITNHSSLVISTELISRSISIPNLSSSLSASPPPPPPPPVYDEKPIDQKIVYEKPCDYTNGRWNCVGNSRPDLGFLYWKWKPSECNLPRFDPNTFLQLISNKHVAFVGDSLSRNHIESLLSMLTTVTKPNGFSHQGSTRWVLPSHNATLSFYWSPFLVQGAWDKGVFVQRLSLIERGKDNLKEKMLRSEGFSLKKWKGLRQGPKNWERLRKAGNFKGFTLEVLDITKLALLRPDGHPGAFMNPFPFAKGVPKHVQNDCVHWCLPGPIDTWNEIFLEMMKNMAQKQLVRSEE
ncbi:Protein ALTERED XYLOGLUCAN 4 isoform B [Glycine soja]|uniref:Protein ALTERED XYLOGLUCAN 4 isoform B n=1 Tax=Glycine soja TaxID=3848 RepID=A0A445LIV8_GLYSO|nr:Protein ALTERED XYLOGLUCAN 4 isoform B [Glycine soja]